MWSVRVSKHYVLCPIGRSISIQRVLNNESSVEYPPILDLKPGPSKLRLELETHEKIRNLHTIEEKTIGINMPRYYGWQSFVVKDKVIPYDFLPFAQTTTKTKLNLVETLPNYVSNEVSQQLIDRIKPHLEDCLVFEHNRTRSRGVMKNYNNFIESPSTNEVAKSIVEQVNRILLANLSAEYPHLFEAQVDYEPRIEAFWNVHGFAATKEDEEMRKKKNEPEENLKDPVDRWIHYFGQPTIQIRHKLPLPILPTNKLTVATSQSSGSDKFQEYDVPNYDYDPKIYLKLPYERRHGVSIPGFWPNDDHKFGLLSIHTNEYLENRPPNFGEEEHQEAIHAQAILASFAWLVGQAHYQGFTACNEITYPFVNQSIITNGKLWSFYAYQLNTMRFFKSQDEINRPLEPNNICWATKATELYHDIKDNRIVGWNDNVLKDMLSCYINTPQARDHELSPYLGEENVIANIDDNKRRAWLHDRHQRLTSHRPRHHLEPEIYDWERIYKIKFETRQFEPRRRFFELDQDPLNERRLDGHLGHYIPRKFRNENLRTRRKRFENTYYPDV
ncbi:28S ribosomal protein S30, mitochondrial [Adelges cooleyi]|uniref:28S ribosomal protein S30, mitochondrial n=1 Tax=Adelges cooleyi TaxID=133065 RepID=UPI00217FF607|nr:28S ribosomal protein S30, mitochondrial [Adelges cooleyi]